MAGGINLPGIGVGVGPVVGSMSFDQMQEGPIAAALRAYGLGQQGKGFGIENLMNAKKLPLIEPSMRAQMNLHNAQAAKEMMLVDLMKNMDFGNAINGTASGVSNVFMRPPGESQYSGIANMISPQLREGFGLDMGLGGSMPQQIQNPIDIGAMIPISVPKNQGNSMFGSDLRQQLGRALIGLPPQTPQEKYMMDLQLEREKQRIQKESENLYGTTQTISDTQNRLKGTEGVIPILEELIAMDVPSQVGFELPWGIGSLKQGQVFSPGKQAAYQAKVEAAKERQLAAMGLSGTVEGLHTVEKILGRRGWESEEDYKNRLKDEVNSLIRNYEELGGRKKFKRYDLEEKGSEKANKSSQRLSIDDPKVIYTANKYGITPQQVLEDIQG